MNIHLRNFSNQINKELGYIENIIVLLQKK